MLFKHPSLCRFPHGHSRRVEVVISADRLDQMDMVCDFKVIKLAMGEYLKKFDHAMVVNSDDPVASSMDPVKERVIALPETDPTTEVLAKLFFDYLQQQMQSQRTWTDDHGNVYRFPLGVHLERLRVWETSTSWGEYALD